MADKTNSWLDPPADENVDVSTPATASDSDPLQMTPEREEHALTKSTSDTQTRSSIPDEEELDAPMRWPIRHNSASSDPVTRERRVKRLGHLIERAKHRAAPERKPLQTPVETVRVHRVHAVANPGKRRTSATVTPKLLWLTRPLGHHQAGAERLLRRAGRHMKPKSGSHAEGTLPILTPSEESDRSRVSAPEYAVLSRRASSGGLSGRSIPNIEPLGYNHRHERQPSLQLLSEGHRNRKDSLFVNPSSSPRSSITPSTDSGSHSSRRSVKSTCADVATTKADVQAVTVSPVRGSDDSSSCGTQTSVKHVVESGHGAWEIVWDDRSSPAVDADECSSRPRSNSDPCASRPSLSASRRGSYHSSPPGLMGVNTKLEEWCFAAREATALDRTRSHPHFRSYVEVYQDPEVPTFDFDEDSSENLTMAPPNSALHSTLASRRASMDTTPRSLLGSASPSPQHTNASESETEDLSVEYRPYTPLVDLYEPELIIPSGYYSPRPNRRVKSSDRLKPQSRSFSGLSSLSEDTHDLLSVPQTYSSNPYCDTPTVGTTHQQRQIFRLQQERYPFLPNSPLGGDLLNAAHRDSIVLAKDRIRRKHAAAAGPTGDLPIPKQPGSTAPALTTGPIIIPVPRPPSQLTFVGALSPIPDGSPPNWVKGIEERAKEEEERKKAVKAETRQDEEEIEKKDDDDGHDDVEENAAVDATEAQS
ncbi:hypothetical protein IWX90DRAFT_414057 [Phyllosticta citrichinensis]|uniref:Uncharacterized protein n=1 Tax=Phyllosticta citrichinensis TaxID=1130410 RepID=A0ABR1XW41_9PEZI